jgi:hypothetical protein
MATLITREQREHDRLLALADIYQGVDRILTGDRIKVLLAEDPSPVPAWSTGDTIYLNSRRISTTDMNEIAQLHGLNVHELSHVLFSPRKGSTFMVSVLEENLNHAANILEDQRIETLLTAIYPSTRHWLQAAVARYVLNAPEDALRKSYVLLRGRRYLPGALRGASRAQWERKEVLADIDRIVDTYRLLAYPKDYAIGLELVREFNAILEQTFDQMPEDPFGHGSRPEETLSSGRPRPLTEQRNARDRAEDGEKEFDPKDTESDDEDDSQSQGSGEDDAQDDATDSSAGTEPGTEPGDESSGLRDAAQELFDDVLSREDVRREVNRTMRQMLGRSAAEGEMARRVVERSPSPEYVGLSRQFRKSLERLVRQADPGWHSRESSGRVNPLRWAQEQDIDSAFDRWDEGLHDAVDLEVVILFDESGSMGQRIDQAIDSMWATKRALDQIGASTTVIGFSFDARVLYRAKDRASTKARFAYEAGGTVPVHALRQASEIFQYSRRAQKILLIFTDGDWSDRVDDFDVSPHEYITRMNRSGVVSALGFIPDPHMSNVPEPESYTHECSIASVVQSTNLVTFIQRIVTRSIRQRLSRR